MLCCFWSPAIPQRSCASVWLSNRQHARIRVRGQNVMLLRSFWSSIGECLSSRATGMIAPSSEMCASWTYATIYRTIPSTSKRSFHGIRDEKDLAHFWNAESCPRSSRVPLCRVSKRLWRCWTCWAPICEMYATWPIRLTRARGRSYTTRIRICRLVPS